MPLCPHYTILQEAFFLGKLLLLLQARSTFGEIFPGFSWGSWVSTCPALAEDTTICRKDTGARPGAWAQLVASLLLLAVGFSLATWQLHTRGSSTETVGSVAPPPHGHSHHPGVYHHGAIISPAGQ